MERIGYLASYAYKLNEDWKAFSLKENSMELQREALGLEPIGE